MHHQANVRTNTKESDRVKDKEKKREPETSKSTIWKKMKITKTQTQVLKKVFPPKFTQLNAFARQDPP